jgi:D-glycero-alpha-D-manno-heptose-7-phosphate kinase
LSEDTQGHEPVTVRVPVRIDFAGGWSDVHYFSSREGGAVVNAAITPHVVGTARWDERELRLDYTLPLPPTSHLGSSASIDVAWLALTAGLMGEDRLPVELAELAYRIEKLLGTEGGKQDQYAAALGGFNLLRFGNEDEPAQVERLGVLAETIDALQERLVLCYAGPPPSAGSVHEQVWERYRAGDDALTAALREIRDSAFRARDALISGDLEALGGVLTANREAARRLHKETVSARMDGLFAAGEQAGALGSKACGEGGGGCLLFLCAEGRRDAVEEALRTRDGVIYPFQFVPPSG